MHSVQQLGKEIGRYLSKHSGSILMGCGIAGVVTTAVVAVRATPDALEDISIAEAAKGEKLTHIEVVKTAGKRYIPALIIGGVSISCLIGAQSINARKQAALASLYVMTSDNFKEYRETVREQLGDKKSDEVEHEVARKKLESAPPVASSEIIMTDGTTLCYDAWSGRYFKSSMEKIQSAINDLNHDINRDYFASLNDLYFLLGLPTIQLGEYTGWNAKKLVDVYFSSQIAENGEPCLVLNFHTAPSEEYSHI